MTSLFFFERASFAESLPESAKDGVVQYNREEFDQALKSFEDAKSAQPDNPMIAYNLANSHYRMGNYDQAVQAYNHAESNLKDPKLKLKSLYNKGNALYRMGYLDKAIESYKKALELNPDDMDSKFNLEFARNMLDRAEQSGRVMPRDPGGDDDSMPGGINPPAPNQENNENDDSGRSPETQTEDGPEKHDENAEEQAQSGDGQESESDQQDLKPQKPENAPNEPAPDEGDNQFADALDEATGMSEEEAEQWLDSLNEDLKKFAQRQMQGQMKDVFVDTKKDW